MSLTDDTITGLCLATLAASNKGISSNSNWRRPNGNNSMINICGHNSLNKFNNFARRLVFRVSDNPIPSASTNALKVLSAERIAGNCTKFIPLSSITGTNSPPETTVTFKPCSVIALARVVARLRWPIPNKCCT